MVSSSGPKFKLEMVNAGLLGSQKVASAYKKEGKEIVGMLQSDMTGYSPPGKKRIVGIATDYVDADLSAFLQKLSTEYNGIPWKNVKCGCVFLIHPNSVSPNPY